MVMLMAIWSRCFKYLKNLLTLRADYMANFGPPTGRKFCCDYRANFSPGALFRIGEGGGNLQESVLHAFFFVHNLKIAHA